MSRSKLFGAYLHSLVVHAATQLEIISLSSVNTENQERIIKEVRCYEAKIEESEKGRQPPGVEPRTPLA